MDILDLNDDLLHDDEIFIVNEIKPINNLSKSLLTKHSVIHSLKGNGTSCKLKNKAEHKEGRRKCNSIANANNKTQSREDTNKLLDVSKTTVSLKEDNQDDLSSKRKLQQTGTEVENERNKNENITLSPGVTRKIKKFKVHENVAMTSSAKKNFNKKWVSPIKAHKITPPSKCCDESTYTFSPGKTSNKKTKTEFICEDESKDEFKKKFDDNAELLCFILKNIISQVTKDQTDLKNESNEKLFSVQECDILEKFCQLNETYCKVFVRLLCRSKLWYRISTLSFKDVNVPLEEVFEALNEANLVSSNIANESLQSQMHWLNKEEVQTLCKTFRISIKSNPSNKKTDLINSLIQSAKNQKSVIGMFCKGNTSSSLINKLQMEVSKSLGTCITIHETVKSTFNKVILLFSFPHYFDEEEKRLRSQLYMCMNVHKKWINYPDYKLSSVQVFETCEDFDKYSEALSLQEKFINAVNSKNYDEFISVTQKAKNEFQELLSNEKFIERYNRLKPFLKRFSGGHIYAKLLTKFCNKFKTQSNIKEIISVAQVLLAQDHFLLSKRGKWYEILSQGMESVKDYKTVAETLIQAQKDPHVDEVQKFVLQLRGQALLKKKNTRINDDLRELLKNVCSFSISEPLFVEITGKALEGNKSGFKSVYIENTENGKMYTSVEERALLHYKSADFPKGCHVEGYIVQSLYGLLFFDIIYETSPAGVFLSAYQEAPLDLYTSYFYLNRKVAIDNRLHEMSQWTEEEAEIKLKSTYYKNINTLCIIAWKDYFSADIFCEIMKCITLPVLAKICKRLILNYRVAKPGFPDLTLWNPESKKCKFVEVKSPNDKLSPGQRIWLSYLTDIGVDCEVCNVKNVSRKLVL